MVALPRFSSIRSKHTTSEKPAAPTSSPSDEASNDAPPTPLSKAQIKRATRTRTIFALLCSFSLFLSVIFLILVEVGGTSIKPVLTDIYFIRLDLSHIIPVSVPNAVLINSIAQSLGLHDFYQVGLWGFCEGYFNPTDVTYCSHPKTLYYFNPIEIIQSELLAGASSKFQLQACGHTPSADRPFSSSTTGGHYRCVGYY